MYHMAKASIRDLRYQFSKIERLLQQREEVQITKRRKVIARLIPEKPQAAPAKPDFMARLHKIYGKKAMPTTGAELVAEDRDRA